MFKTLLTIGMLATLLGSFSSCKSDLQPEVTPVPAVANKNRQARLPEEEEGVDLKSTYFVRINGVYYFDGAQINVRPGQILEIYHRKYYSDADKARDRSGEAFTSAWEVPSGWILRGGNYNQTYSFNDYRRYEVGSLTVGSAPIAGELVLRHWTDNYDYQSKLVRIQVGLDMYY